AGVVLGLVDGVSARAASWAVTREAREAAGVRRGAGDDPAARLVQGDRRTGPGPSVARAGDPDDAVLHSDARVDAEIGHLEQGNGSVVAAQRVQSAAGDL